MKLEKTLKVVNSKPSFHLKLLGDNENTLSTNWAENNYFGDK